MKNGANLLNSTLYFVIRQGCLFVAFLCSCPSFADGFSSYVGIGNVGGLTHIRPDFIGGVYGQLGPSFFHKIGGRIGIDLIQPEMPNALRIEERDYRFLVEGALIWNLYLPLSLGVGTGLLHRSTKLVLRDSIEAAIDDPITDRSNLGILTVQLGVGMPIEGGIMLLEPYFRYVKISKDTRQLFELGFDFSFAF
jgi:hypothetical protein